MLAQSILQAKSAIDALQAKQFDHYHGKPDETENLRDYAYTLREFLQGFGMYSKADINDLAARDVYNDKVREKGFLLLDKDEKARRVQVAIDDRKYSYRIKQEAMNMENLEGYSGKNVMVSAAYRVLDKMHPPGKYWDELDKQEQVCALERMKTDPVLGKDLQEKQADYRNKTPNWYDVYVQHCIKDKIINITDARNALAGLLMAFSKADREQRLLPADVKA